MQNFLPHLELWFTSFVVFGGVATLGWALWRVVTSRFLNYARRSHPHISDELIDIFIWPVRLIILVVAIRTGLEFAPNIRERINTINLIVQILLISAVFWVMARGIVYALRQGVLLKTLSEPARGFAVKFTRVFLTAIFILIVLDTVGISITPLLASLGVGSVAVALALQDTLSNLFSGIYILLDKPIRVGDYVRVDGVAEGYVVRIGLRSTLIRTETNNINVIPNSKAASSLIINYDLEESQMSVIVPVGVSYNADLSKVERVTLEVAKQVLQKVDGGVSEHEPTLRYRNFGDSSINFNVSLRVHSWDKQYAVVHEFIKSLHLRYKTEGIDIPYPQRVVHTVSSGQSVKDNEV